MFGKKIYDVKFFLFSKVYYFHMNKFTLAQRLEIVHTLYQNLKGIVATQRAFLAKYGHHSVSSELAIYHIIDKSESAFNLHNSKPL